MRSNFYKYLVFLFLMVFLLPTTVFAQEKFELKVDKTDLKVGDEITVSANVPSNLDAYALMATLKYDKNVFQTIDDSNFDKKDVSSILYSKETNKFGIINKTGKISTGDTLFTVKLKVKDDANVGNTNIALTNISYSDGNGKKTLDMVSTKVSVSRDAKEGEIIPSNTENDITEDIEKDITVQTNTPIIITLCVIMFVLLVAILNIILKKKNKKIIYVLVGLEVLAIITTSILITKNINKKDVNKDGVRDYADAEEIIKYLISIEGTEENTNIPDSNSNSNTNNTVNNESQNTNSSKTNNSSSTNSSNKNNGTDTDIKQNQTNQDNSNTNTNTDNNTNNTTNDNTVNNNENLEPNQPDEDKKPDYDTNNDGNVDIDDAGQSTEEANKNSSAKLDHIKSEIQYVTKGEDIILAFKAEITPKGTDIKKVKIGDKYYEVTKDGDTYNVNIGLAENSGLYNYEITRVILSNKKEIKANLKFVVEILKSKPTIENLYITDNSKLHFTLIDKDKSVITGRIIIKDESDKTIKTIDMSLDKTEMEYELGELEKNTKYTLSIEVTYDLDEDRNNNKNETTEVIKTHDFLEEQEETEYAFNIKDFKLIKIEDGKVIVQFTSNTDKNNKIETAEIYLNDVRHEYQVTEAGNKHTIEIPVTDTNGRTEINIKGVILNNLNVFNSETNKDLFESLEKIVVFKNKPTVEIGKIDVTDEDLATTITVNDIDITDYDKTITNKYAILKLNNNEVKRISLTNESKITFNHDLDEIFKAGNYTVDIVATYDLVDGNGITEATLKTDIAIINAKAKITKTNIPEKFVEKEKNVALEYTIESNTGSNVSELTINSNSYKVANLENNVYKADYKAKDVHGFEKISLTNIKFENDMVVNLSEINENTIDVLKDKPQIEDVNVTNENNTAIITFNVIDPDDALNESYMIITDKVTNQEQCKKQIQKGENKFEVELESETLYELTIENNATLSHGNEGEIRTYNSTYHHNGGIHIFDEKHLDFSIKNLSVPYRIANNAKDVTITFENEILTTETVSNIRIDGTDYNVNKTDDGIYSVKLDIGNKGLNKLHVESVTLGGKTFDVDRILPYVRENIAPEANDVNITENLDNGNAEVKYVLTDTDNAITGLKANLRNSSGAIVETKTIDGSTTEEFTMPLTKSYIYSIELVATYDIGDGKTFVEKSLFRKEQNGEPFVSIAEKSIKKNLVEKGEEVTLTYKLNTNIDKEVSKLFIGDISYPVKKALNGKQVIEDTYEVTVPAPKASGIFKQEVTRAVIGNKPYIVQSEKEPIAINVAKDKPTVTQFTIDPKEEKILFKLNDKDDALKGGGSAKLLIFDNDTSSMPIEKNLNAGDNEFSFNDLKLSVGKNYTAKVEAKYNLNPTMEMNILQKVMNLFSAEDEYISEDIFDRNIEVPEKTDYKFDFQPILDFSIINVEPYEAEPNLTFKFTSDADSTVSKVVIDGEEFSVKSTGKEDEYELDHYIPVNFRVYDAHYEKVILENGISFNVEHDIFQMVTVPSAKLEIVDFQETFEENKSIAKFYFNIIDPDNVIDSNLTLYLKNSKGETIGTNTDITKDQKGGSVEFNVTGKESSEYRIGGYATQTYATNAQRPNVYLVDMAKDPVTKDFVPVDIIVHSSRTTTILNSDIGNATVGNVKVNTRYPEQETTIPITYSISSTKVTPNTDKLDKEELAKATIITSLIINGKDYPVETVSSTRGEYKVYYPVPNTPGVHEVKLTEVVFSNAGEVETEEVKRTDKIDVLKKTPTLENFETINNVEDGTVTFDFDLVDENNVLENTTVTAMVGNETQNVKVGEHNKLIFKAQRNQVSTFEIKASYDLDSDTLEQDKNNYTNQTIVKKQFVLTDDYNANLTDIKVVNAKGEETQYFEKGEKINLSFNFNLKYKGLYPEKIEIDKKEYKLTKDINDETRFLTTIDGYDNYGKKYVNINSVILNSGNKVTLEGKEKTLEILKDAPILDDFAYSLNDNIITLDIQVEDEDNSILNNNIYISAEDEFGRLISLSSNTLKLGNNTITFDKNESLKYMITISAEYSRDNEGDTNHSHYYKKGEIANKVVSVTESNHIVLKDITNIDIYKFNEQGEVEKSNTLTEKELKKFVNKNYLVKISMKDLPEVYAEIKNAKKSESGYELELDYKDAMVYINDALTPLTLKLTGTDGNYTYSNNLNSSSKSVVDNNYLPDEEMARKLSEYKDENKLVYHNMYKLMPFNDIKEIIKNGNKVVTDASDSELTTKTIKYVLAYNKSGKLVNYLTTKNYDNLSRIRVVFTNNTGKDYNLNFDSFYGNVTSYIIKELRVPYNYNKYVVKADNDAIKQITKNVDNLDYDRELDPLSNFIKDSRLYKEHYEEVIDKKIDDIITSILVRDNYIPTFENDLLKSMIRDKYKSDVLKELLYSYNYLDYWYDINMNGANISDTLAFHGKEMFNNNNILEEVEKTVIYNKTSETTNTIGFYNTALKKFTPTGNGNIVNFMEFYITALTNYETGNDWFKDNWHGGVYKELDVETMFNIEEKKGMQYSFWWHFSQSGNVQKYFLSLFNVPDNGMYIVSLPTQVLFGSLRTYVNTTDFNNRLNNFSLWISRFYYMVSIYSDVNKINQSHQIVFDHRYIYPEGGKSLVMQSPGTTTDPYFKYFAESNNKWATGGVGAFATGPEVFFVAYESLGRNMQAITHESAHNQDDNILLKGYGKRAHSGGEDYAEHAFAQSWGDGVVSPNFIEDSQNGSGLSTHNWSYKRIDTNDKLKDYYNKLYKVNDYLDYLEAEAFLGLSAEQKAKIARQVKYEGILHEEENNKKDIGGSTISFQNVSEDLMKTVTSREALWDNRIILRQDGGVIRPNYYDTDTMYGTHWYQAHNNDGRPDTASMKYLFWEMAGIGGYYDGFLAYASSRYIQEKKNNKEEVTDLIALRYVTQDDDITFKEYKLNKYKSLENNYGLSFNGKYINGAELLEKFKKAMEQDAAANDRSIKNTAKLKKEVLLKIKTDTEDLVLDPFAKN